jgi:hypothetical protein
MHCPECDRPAPSTGRADAGVGPAMDAMWPEPACCGTCMQPYHDTGAELLRLLTQLANCGLTAAAPPVLSAAETGS